MVWYTHIYQNFVLCKPGVLQKEGGNTEWQHTSPKAQSEQMNCAARTHVSMERMMWKRHEAWIHENVEWRTTRMENFARKSIKHPVRRSGWASMQSLCRVFQFIPAIFWRFTPSTKQCHSGSDGRVGFQSGDMEETNSKGVGSHLWSRSRTNTT